ncbi:MAG: hypothetical protein AB8U44_03790, partial [Aaplasma endosymbiont of Hyalomma asiaticum]
APMSVCWADTTVLVSSYALLGCGACMRLRRTNCGFMNGCGYANEGICMAFSLTVLCCDAIEHLTRGW